jgi:hypothetical protein
MVLDLPLCFPCALSVTKYWYVTLGLAEVSLYVVPGGLAVVVKIFVGRLVGEMMPVARHTWYSVTLPAVGGSHERLMARFVVVAGLR